MRLSQHERRMLAELEQALTQEDPRFVQQFAAPPTAATSPPARGLRRLLRLLTRRRP
jgi:hypothetical protein